MRKSKSNNKVKDFFALDIGSSSVKVLQLNKELNDWSIVGIGHSPINRAVVADKSVMDNDALASAIETAIKNAGIKTKNVYAAMPNAQATSKIITIPDGMSVIEQENFVQLEATNHIPYAIEEVRLDFDVLGKNKTEPNLLDVLLVASKIDELQMRVDAAIGAGLKVEVMDIDEYAIERAMHYILNKYPLTEVESPIEVVVDLGHEFTIIHVLNEGKSIYNREQNFGMKQLTDEVSKRFGLSAAETQAGIIKNKLPQEFQNEILPQFRSEVASQINRLIQFFFAATSFNRVHRIWISGGGGGLDGVTEEVADVTGVLTKIADPLFGVSLGKGVDQQYVKEMGPAFLTAFGLAIRED